MDMDRRTEMYGLLSRLFYQPTADGLAGVDTAAALRRLADYAPVEPVYLAMTVDDLRQEFFRVFTHSISKDCPPYETEYGEAHVFMQTQDLGDIQGFYRAFGVKPAELAHERPDQLGFELEFMSFLAAKEVLAPTAEAASICRDASAKFMRDHLLRWVPPFCVRLERRAPASPYGVLARILKDWIDRDARELGVDPASVRSLDLKPASYDPDTSDCSSCGIGDVPETFFNQGAKP